MLILMYFLKSTIKWRHGYFYKCKMYTKGKNKIYSLPKAGILVYYISVVETQIQFIDEMHKVAKKTLRRHNC